MPRDNESELAKLLNEVQWLDTQHQQLQRRAEYVQRRLAALSGDGDTQDGGPDADAAAAEPDSAARPAAEPPTDRDRLGRKVHRMPRIRAAADFESQAASLSRTMVPAPGRDVSTSVGVAAGLIGLAAAVAVVGACWAAAERGWIAPTARVAAIAVVAACVLAAACRAGRSAMGAIGLVAGLVGLYAAAYIAGPQVDGLISPSAALAALCIITLLGGVVAAGVRSRPTALVAAVGGYITPLTLEMATREPVVWMIYLLALTGGALLLAAACRWPSVSAVALSGTLVLMWIWLQAFYAPGVTVGVVGYAWCLLGLFAVYAVAADAGASLGRPVAMLIVGAVAAALVALLVAVSDDLPDYAIGAQWLGLDAGVLGLCLWRRWRGLRLVALAWTTAGVGLLWWLHDPAVATCLGWTWAFYALFALDGVLWAVWSSRPDRDRVGAVVAGLATAAMVPTTWAFAGQLLGPWMAAYAAGVGSGMIVLGLLLRLAPARPVAAPVYLVAGLACVAIATPLQFNGEAAAVGLIVEVAGLLAAAILIQAKPLRYAACALLAAGALNVGWSQLPALALVWRVGVCVLAAAVALIIAGWVTRTRRS